jgi:D-lactate dehydrogenase (cytochrome)
MVLVSCSFSLIFLRLIVNTIVGTGEHGVGIGKKEYLVEELGAGTVKLMRTIKDAIDPLGLFNPGKVSISFEVLLVSPLMLV